MTNPYVNILSAAERSAWRVQDLIGGDKKLDFTRPFLPESLARTSSLDMLNAGERLALNQIRGHGYLYTFGLVEEFILPFVLDHARPRLSGDDHRTRALLHFASEEAKHIHLFKRFREEFESGFGTACEVIGPPEEIARAVLAHHPLAVALAILHIEWMTQGHYSESVHDDLDLDPCFKSLLKHHWMEEAQHARIDELMVAALAATCSPDEIAESIDQYLEIGGILDSGMLQQAELDLRSFQRHCRRDLTPAEKETIRRVQVQGLRWTFLGSGMTHPRFLASIETLHPESRQRIEGLAVAFR